MKLYDRFLNKFWRIIFLPKSSIIIKGEQFRIPRLQNNNFYRKTYLGEKWLERILISINGISKLNTVLDIGVNIGQTLLKLKSVNPDVKYFGFEPNPFCCSMTQQIISINNLRKCEIIPCGLSDKSQLLKLTLASKVDLFDSSATLIEGFREPKSDKIQYVSVLNLDEIIHELEIDELDLIKIDIEGGELEAVKGMMNTVKTFQPLIIMEVLPSYNDENTFRISRQDELSKLINSVDYNIFHIKNKEGVLRFESIKNFPVHQNINESDYLLTPKHINISTFNTSE